jgi:signal transduction histidine kinase
LIEGPGAAPVPSPHQPVDEPGPRAWLRTRWKERATWREFSYAIVLAMLIGPLSVFLIAGLAFSLVMLSTPALAFIIRLGGNPFSAEALADAGDALPAGLIGLGGTLVGAYVLALLATAQALLTRALLMPREEEYREQVLSLTRSRVRLVEAFEAERRRIERDLHDGAQQRLAALSVTLGLARLELSGLPGRGAELVARAAEEAKQAQAELRRLIWGIHPQVLTDRGIGAAVSHLAAMSPVPVSVSMRLTERLPSPIEAAAYFAVSEALANVTKHSQASQAEIAGVLQEDCLVITVTDDGVGGADPREGSGLQGLADRLSVLCGKLELFSPVRGPTTLRVEIPCGLVAHSE